MILSYTGKYSNSQWVGTLKSTVKQIQNQGDLELNISTDNTAPFTGTFTLNKSNGAVAKFEATTSDKDKLFSGGAVGVGSVDYSTDKLSGNITVKSDGVHHKVDSSIVGGIDGFNVGGSVSLNVSGELQLLDANIGGEFNQNNQNIYTVYTSKNLDYLNFSFINNWQKSRLIHNIFGGNQYLPRLQYIPTTFGALATINIHNAQQHTLTAVAETILTPSLIIKKRFEYPKNYIDLSVEHKLSNPAVTIGFAARFNGKNILNGLNYGAEKFGISLSYDV